MTDLIRFAAILHLKKSAAYLHSNIKNNFIINILYILIFVICMTLISLCKTQANDYSI